MQHWRVLAGRFLATLHPLPQETKPVTKLPYVRALAATAPLLAGCVTTSGTEPGAAPVSATISATTAAPSATPAPAESATPSPAVSDSPSSGPTQAPTPEHTATVTTPPADSGTPVTEPQITEPPVADLTTEAPVEPPIVVTLDPRRESEPRITVEQGSSFTATGSGYQAGQQILFNMGVYQTDGMVLEEQSFIADATGGYSFTVTIGPDLPPQTYGVFTMVREGVNSPEEFEATKQFAIIEVVPG
ncbi:hypothetical protein PTW37_06930 [Arthrobacter agilis]|uniref:hypothetical protein n=1 Tax=Arthrobacter agilis TaxID=37921 RepID=UPI0023666C41|nr:hypothetical protein [Arthrobacter agilis]WDF34623.1 hypothetical protein PTW37_06930 [Arthrobacter agilis]